MRPLRMLVVALGVFLLFRQLGSEPAVQGDELGPFRFVDVAAEAGIDVRNVCGDARRWYIPESNGNGAAWLDYDGDGDQDLFVGNGQELAYHDDGARLEIVRSATSRLYRNEGFMRFADVSVETGTDRRDWVNAVTVGDVDSDGDPDLYLGCFGADVLLRKEGNRYAEATRASGLGNELWAAGAAFADPDRDGDLDLYVANYCLFDLDAPPAGGKRHVIGGVEVAWGPEGENGQGYNAGAPDAYYVNDGKGRFREHTAAAGFALEKALCSYAAVWSDVTADGWPDLMVANDLQPANLFVNQRDGRFRDEALERGFALNHEGKPTSGMGLLVEDVDGDGDMDVLRTNFDMEANCLHVNDGKGNFQDKAGAYGLAESSMDKLGWGGAFFDADRDGDVDLLVANGHVYPQGEAIGLHSWMQPTQLFEGVPHRSYRTVWQEVTQSAGSGLAPLRSARGVALGDPDDDGDHDVLIVDVGEPPRLLRNDSAAGHWIGLDLRGKLSNRDAYGARVQVEAGKQTWTREVRATNGLYSSHDKRVLVGLGTATQVDAVTIVWPNGEVQTLERPAIDRYHEVIERFEAR
jgi:hypothetical protein